MGRQHMTDFDPFEDDRCIALDNAIDAARGAVQAAAGIWEMLAPAEQDRWLEHAEIVWPRRDVALKTLLPAADKILGEMRAADS
jgi:hypothetical protein